MSRKFRYGVIGNGQWGKRIQDILIQMERDIVVFDISRRFEQTTREYENYILNNLKKNINNVDIFWLAVPPGDQYTLCKSILGFNKHIIVEKPWMENTEKTKELLAYSSKINKQIGVHFQYCYLDCIEKILKNNDKFSIFNGAFCVSKENRLSIPAIYNLGSHLFSIKELYFPHLNVGKIETGYNKPDARYFELKGSDKEYVLDFFKINEPLIQRFVKDFEKKIDSEENIDLNLDLCLRINQAIRDYSESQKNFN